MMIKFTKNKSKKSTRNIRNNKKKVSEPSVVVQTTTRHGDKKKAPVLVYDMKTGVVMDEATGNKFILQPLND